MRRMKKTHQRIKDRRIQLGLSQDGVASRLGQLSEKYKDTNRGTISKIENGKMSITSEWMEDLAKVLDCNPKEFISDKETTTIQVVGYVGAGEAHYFMDDHAKGNGLEEIVLPFVAPKGTVGLRVRGDSMAPRMEDGDLVLYVRDGDGVPHNCIGQPCVVRMPDDRTLVKKLKSGSKPGLYHLTSYNADPLLDQKVVWASKVIAILP